MPRESSAVMRFIDLVQNQPIIEKPLEEPSAFAEPSSSFPIVTEAERRRGLPRPDERKTTLPPPIPTQAMDTQVVRTLPGPEPSRSKLWYGVGAIAFLGLGIGIGVLANGGGSPDSASTSATKASAANTGATSNTDTASTQTPTPVAKAEAKQPEAKPPAPTPTPTAVPVATPDEDKAPAMTAEQLKQTGFDIRVSQEGATVTLDGKEIGKAPLRVRNLKSGAHTIAITAPAGYMSLTKEVELGVGEAKELTLELEKVKVKLPATIVANFVSEPPGATVTIFTNDQKLISKTTPIKMKLRTGHEYRAEFARAGYETITRPVEIADDSELKVAVVMQAKRVAVKTKRAAAPRRNLRRPTRRAAVKRRARTKARTRTARRTPRRATKKAATKKGFGTLLIGSKPPCRIYINGRPTGLTTPQRGIKLKAGKHRVSLINRQFKIRRTVSVRIRSGKRTRVIRDFSHKIRR